MPKAGTSPFQLWRFLLSSQGRISRRAYALFIMPAIFAPGLLRGAVRYSILHHGLTPIAIFSNLAITVLDIALVWSKFVSTAKRAHDFGWRTETGIVNVLPFVASVAYGIYYVLSQRAGLNLTSSPWRPRPQCPGVQRMDHDLPPVPHPRHKRPQSLRPAAARTANPRRRRVLTLPGAAVQLNQAV